jgi:heptosyltransferase-3
MQRYSGQALPEDAHITVLGSCKVGNLVVTIPLLTCLRRSYPNSVIDFWGSTITQDFEEALCREGLINWRISWDEDNEEAFSKLVKASEARKQHTGPIHLLINCDGFNPVTRVLASWLRPTWVAGGSMNQTLRSSLPWGDQINQKFLGDADWDSPEFLERNKQHFKSNYIAELICRMAYMDPSEDDLRSIDLPWENPGFEVPDILIHCTTTREAKIWPFDRWVSVVKWCEKHRLTVGLVGAAPKRQIDLYHAGMEEQHLIDAFEPTRTLVDLRGKTTLIQLAGACRFAKAVVSVDAGPLHIAAASGTPTLAVVGNDQQGVGASPVRLWMPRAATLERTVSSHTCSTCRNNQFKNDGCLENNHHCMLGVDARQVTNWLAKTLGADHLHGVET